jgi:hypothetical protein
MIFKFSRLVTFAMACSLAPADSIAMPDTPADKATSIETARNLADNAFKKATIGKVKNFSVRLIENSAIEWVFVYEDVDVLPRPGSEIYVEVSKLTQETSWYYGK